MGADSHTTTSLSWNLGKSLVFFIKTNQNTKAPNLSCLSSSGPPPLKAFPVGQALVTWVSEDVGGTSGNREYPCFLYPYVPLCLVEGCE